MNQLSNEEFIIFINSFKKDFLYPISKISKSKNSNKSLIESDFKMFSFDDMCKKYKKMRNNLPKSMDALHYELLDNNKLILYLIEFKSFNIEDDKSTYGTLQALHNKLKKLNKKSCPYSDEKFVSDATLKKFDLIKEYFVDSIEFDLITKPFESIFISLPLLYKEYCNEHNLVEKDIKVFLNNIDIKLFVFINRYSPNTNVSGNRLSAHVIDNKLKSVYNRLYLADVIVKDNERIFSQDKFDPYFIKKENLTEKSIYC